MAEKNTSEAPRPHNGLSNLFLLVLHVGVLIVSIWVHPVNLASADRALPDADRYFVSLWSSVPRKHQALNITQQAVTADRGEERRSG